MARNRRGRDLVRQVVPPMPGQTENSARDATSGNSHAVNIPSIAR